jgi:proteasome accessory factor B
MSAPKLQRWLDLLATLLARRSPATFLDLARDVPAYLADGSVAAESPSDTLKRMFERDKLELREMGVPIISVGDEGDEELAYQLRTKDFYLPYLAIMSERGVQAPEKVDRYGYRSLETLAFEPDELEAIRDGAQRVTQIGDAALTDDAKQALQKLAFDLPLGVTDGSGSDAVVVPPAAQPDKKLLGALGDALFHRKQSTFLYNSMGGGTITTRTVEPYGLFFISGHWYLAARDTDKDGIRNFRVSRMRSLSVNTKKSETPDYEIPSTFALRDHAHSRQAWEIGDGEGFEAVVDFRGNNGAVMAASALGRPDQEDSSLRRFDVRRMDSFARWLLAFGGDAVPVEPSALVDEYRVLLDRTRALYSS